MSLATRYEQTYTVEEVADLLRHSPGGVRAMIRRGALRAIKVGGRYLIPESALDEIGFASLRVFRRYRRSGGVRRRAQGPELQEAGRDVPQTTPSSSAASRRGIDGATEGPWASAGHGRLDRHTEAVARSAGSLGSGASGLSIVPRCPDANSFRSRGFPPPSAGLSTDSSPTFGSCTLIQSSWIASTASGRSTRVEPSPPGKAMRWLLPLPGPKTSPSLL